MRVVHPTLAAALAATLLAVLQALFTHTQLAGVGPRAQMRLDPLGTATGCITLLMTIVIYVWLGRQIALLGGDASRAIAAGAIAGSLAGALGGLAQVHGVRDYLELAVARIYVPAWFLDAILALVAALLTLLGGLVGAVSAWFGARAARKGAGTTKP